MGCPNESPTQALRDTTPNATVEIYQVTSKSELYTAGAITGCAFPGIIQAETRPANLNINQNRHVFHNGLD
jgi:hypothetical protein